ncbi:MAG: hypothetical protein ACRD30_05210 [Bryobacteraceae bacterium]
MFAGSVLARRIEMAEALNAAACGEAIQAGGGYAAFSGVASPLTHAIGLGMSGLVTTAEFDRMEEYYRSRGAGVSLDFCPHADFSLLDLIASRSYRLVECNNVLAGPAVGSADGRVRLAGPGERELWIRTMLEGFFGRTALTEPELEVGRRLLELENATAWLASVDGCPAAAGAMNVRNGLALLFADSTIERFRGRGLHLALIRARLHHAVSSRCDLATASTAPGSISQRNYERAGLRVVYTKLICRKIFPDDPAAQTQKCRRAPRSPSEYSRDAR